jgi:hypothetical protein
MASSSIELLSHIAPISDEEAAGVFGERGRELLLDSIIRQTPARSLRLRSPLVLAVAALVVVAATGSAWALTRGSAQETTAVDCKIGGGTTVIDATSGDPAADCAAIWPAPVPKLQAYDNGLGGVAVIPASDKAPASWIPIPSQDLALIELQESLDDEINGLHSKCFGSFAATTFVRQQIDRLGLIGWTVNVRSASDVTRLCYGGFADPAAKTVTLIATGDQSGPANWPPHRLADSLRPLTQQCLSLPAMKSAVEQRAASLGMSPTVESDRNYQLRATGDDTLHCATVTESVTGTTYVVVRGPAAP